MQTCTSNGKIRFEMPANFKNVVPALYNVLQRVFYFKNLCDSVKEFFFIRKDINLLVSCNKSL